MEERPSVMERAFQIAKSGCVTDISELCAQLVLEGYADSVPVLAGRSIANQIKRMIAAAQQSTTL